MAMKASKDYLLRKTASHFRLLAISGTNIAIFSAMAYIGLLLIAIGTGGIKPCVSSFGGEQFAQ